MSFVNNKKRIMYIDILKVIAIFAIIFNHICLFAGNVKILDIPIMHFKHFGSVGVAIFLMITGALLLNREYNINDFLKKKGKRLILPYLFWICFVFIVRFIVTNATFGLNLVKEYFFTLFIDGGFNWYFWMIIGIYCAIPIINEFIKSKKLKGATYFVRLFLIAIIFYNICIIFNIVTYMDLAFFIGPIAFIILGYYLHNKEFNISNTKLVILGVIGFISMFIIRSIAYPNFELFLIFFNVESIRMVSFIDISIFGVIEAISLFLIIKSVCSLDSSSYLYLIKKFFDNSIIKRFNTSVSKATYGMYLAHMFLFVYLSLTIPVIALSGTKTFISAVIISLIVFFITWVLVLIVNKIPYLKVFSGYS